MRSAARLRVRLAGVTLLAFVFAALGACTTALTGLTPPDAPLQQRPAHPQARLLIVGDSTAVGTGSA